MSKIRLYELADELKLETKVVVARANELGIPVRSHMAALDEEEAEALKASLLAPLPEVVVEDAGLPKAEDEGADARDGTASEAVAPVTASPVALAAEGDAEADAAADAESDAEADAAADAKAASEAQAAVAARAAEDAARPEPGNERDPKPRDPNRDRNRGRDGRRGPGGPGGPAGGRGRSEQPLSQDDPYWQFGTPTEYWGQTRGDRRSDPSGLPPEDPYWQFGSPVESWGSSRKKPGQPDANRSQQQRPRTYLECQTCGVKIEKKRAHGDKKVPCPFCNKWMREVR